tara:strand:+ start:487 stop:1302 length:816 start_codon:yes stop_codon:yes gene_type:complete
MKKIKSFDGVDISYDYKKKRGDLPVLIFLHGVGGNLTLWRKEVKFFSRKGYSTLAFDLRGHGLSGMPQDEVDYYLGNYVKDLRVLLQKEGITNYVLVGHSFGGCVVIAYLASYKTNMPADVVLIESTHVYPYARDHELNLNPLVVHLLKILVARGWFDRHPYEIDFSSLESVNLYKEELFHLPLKTVFYALEEAKLYSDKNNKKLVCALKQLKIPTLVVAGDEDTTIDPKYSIQVYHLVKDSRIVVFRGVGHLLPVLKSRRLCKEMLKFLG